MTLFAANTATDTANASEWAEQPPTCPFTWRIWTPSNTWFFGPTRVSHRNYLVRFSRFCRAHERDQQTNRQIDHATPVCSNNLHLMMYAMPPKIQSACGVAKRRKKSPHASRLGQGSSRNEQLKNLVLKLKRSSCYPRQKPRNFRKMKDLEIFQRGHVTLDGDAKSRSDR